MRVGGGELGRVDDVAAIARQRDAAARLGVGRARLGVLAGDAADADHRLAQRRGPAPGSSAAGSSAFGDRVRAAVVEALGAVAALQQERLPPCASASCCFSALDLPRRDERRQRAQFVQHACERRHPDSRLLQRRPAAPGLRETSRWAGLRHEGCDRMVGMTRTMLQVRRMDHGVARLRLLQPFTASNRGSPFSDDGTQAYPRPQRQQHKPRSGSTPASTGPRNDQSTVGALARAGHHLADAPTKSASHRSMSVQPPPPAPAPGPVEGAAGRT